MKSSFCTKRKHKKMDRDIQLDTSNNSWNCHVCGMKLSRKQRLQSHIKSKHPSEKTPDHLQNDRGMYKTYELDETFPVPKRTKYRLQSDDIQPILVHTQNENCFIDTVDETPNETDELLQCQFPNETDEAICAGSNQEKCMAVLSFISKMRLTGTASEQLLRLLNIFGNEELSSVMLKKNIKEIDAKIYDYCDLCSCVFPEDENVFMCVSPTCVGLRYTGPEVNQHLKRRKSFFASSPLHSQILDILERYPKLTSDSITLTMNTDGVPLYNSSSISLWPVFLVINELKPTERFLMKNVIVWAIWQGKGKPVFRHFLHPLTVEMNSLHNKGIVVGDRTVRIKLSCVTMDLQAKSQVMEMVPHNGQYSCITCEIPGCVTKKGKGHTKTFPVGDLCHQRSSASLLSNAEEALSTGAVHVKGVKNVSVLFNVDHFNPVEGVVPDYMHGVLLGTTKKLLSLWTSKSSSKQPYFIGDQISLVDSRLLKMKPTDNVSRLPRSIKDHLSHWKASEFQHWLLFYSIPCLEGILPTDFFNNLCYLVEGIYILLGESLTSDDLEKAELNLTKFQISFERLYGLQNCGLNVHNIGCHLAYYARIHGPLWSWSCFAFEDMNGILLKSAHGTGNVSNQLLQTLLIQKKLHSEAEVIEHPELREFTMDMLSTGRRKKSKLKCSNCFLLGRLFPIDDREIQDKVLEITNRDSCYLKKVGRIQLNGQVIASKCYKRLVKRNCHTVLTSSGSIKCVDFFIHDAVSDLCFAYTQSVQVVGLLNNTTSHLIKVEVGGHCEVVNVEKVVEKVMFLEGNDDNVCVARLPTLYNNSVN